MNDDKYNDLQDIEELFDIEDFQEEFMKFMKSENKKISKRNYTKDMTLVETLMVLSKDELLDIARNYEIKKYSKLRKADLCNKISETIFNNLDMITYSFTDNHLDFLENLNEEHVNNSILDTLLEFGIIFEHIKDNEFSFFLPSDLYNAIQVSCKKNEMAINANTLISLLIDICVITYGVLTIEDCNRILRKGVLDKEGLEELDTLIIYNISNSEIADIDGDFIYHIALNDIGEGEIDIEEFYNNIQSNYRMDYKTLTKEYVQKYLDEVSENKEETALLELLLSLPNIEGEQAYEMYGLVLIMLSLEADDKDIIEMLGINNKNSKREIRNALSTIKLTHPIWLRKGHFFNEPIFNQNDLEGSGKVIPFQRKEDKISRNDPCPCGSGKKYKKCCGK